METPYDHITVIGYGNVGRQLALGLSQSGLKVDLIVSNSKDGDPSLPTTKFTRSLKDIEANNLVIICVPDDRISFYVEELKEHTLAYTSGSVTLDSLTNHNELGVFYPLQTFTTGRNVPLQNVPFFIESENELHAKKLMATALRLSSNVQFANSEYRRKLHLSAVWINNFTNHIIQRAQFLAKTNGIDIDYFTPLLKETIEKLEQISPYEAQTGPARRGDKKIIEDHLEKLKGMDREIYDVLSRSIEETYK